MKSITSKISSGTTIMVNGQELSLKQLVDGVWNAVNTKTGEYTRISADEIIEHYRMGTIKIGNGSVLAPFAESPKDNPVDVPLDMLPPDKQILVRARRLYLNHLEKHFGTSPDGKSITGHLDLEWSRLTRDVENKPSMQTIRRWMKNYQKSGKNILCLLGKAKFRGNKTHRIDDKLEELGLEALHRAYLNPERRTLKTTWMIFKDLVEKENVHRPSTDALKIPSMTLLKSLLSRLDPIEVHAARYGMNAARVKFRNAVNNFTVDGPFDRYEIDHTRLDIGVVDSRTGIYLGRPWFTMVISKGAKAMMGFIVSMEPPSGESLAKAFKHAILPKDLKETCPEANNDWPMFGVPALIVCDNGAEFYGRSFIDMCLTLGIRVEYMPRKTPWWKGSVERSLRTLMEGVCQLQGGGRTFGSITEKGDYDPVKTAVITMEELEKAITIWIVDVYHQSRHRAIQTTPAWKWKSSVDLSEIVYLEDPNVFDSITGQIDTRQWLHYGIELNCIQYNSPELKDAWNELIGKRKSIKVTVRWSAEDVGQITVMVPNRNPIRVPVKSAYAYAKSMSLRQYKMTRQDLINQGMNPDDQKLMEEATVRLFYSGQDQVKQQKVRKARHKRELLEAADFDKPSMVVESPAPVSVPVFMTAGKSVATPVFKSYLLRPSA